MSIHTYSGRYCSKTVQFAEVFGVPQCSDHREVFYYISSHDIIIYIIWKCSIGQNTRLS